MKTSDHSMLRASAPPEAWAPLLRFARLATRPLERFLAIQAASGILLLAAALVALVWANSPWAATYYALWELPVHIGLGEATISRSLKWLVDDVLMVIFFFVVGLEIRRELDHGELSEWRRAALPATAALGGMLVPAWLYLALAHHGEAASGWGVPMATDIAFAVGILALLGPRVPAALRVLLLAVAVIDDLGAIVVIALFYSSGLSASGFLLALGGFAAMVLQKRFGVRSKWAYVPAGAVIWAGIYLAGVHPTIAGVLIGLATPVRAWLGAEGFVSDMRAQLTQLAATDLAALPPHELAVVLHRIDAARREAMSPVESLIESLHPWVAFGIMPLFAFANAGVTVGASIDAESTLVATAVAVGLVVGKPLGIVGASLLAVRTGLGALPRGLGTRHLLVLGAVGGVGFTMALFIAQLAFTDSRHLDAAKLGVLIASGIAAVIALVAGRLLLSKAPEAGAAVTVDEAEGSTES